MSDAEADVPVAAAEPAPVEKKKATKKKSKKPAKPSAHPKWREMVIAAVTELKERNGSSRQAILKYVIANYKDIDQKNGGNHLKMTLRACVKNGALKQSKGTGMSGSFKLGEKTSTKAKKPAAPKPKKSPAKKASPKKEKATKKKPVAKPKKKATKSPAKAKPKPKKAATKKAAPKKTAKKASPKKSKAGKKK